MKSSRNPYQRAWPIKLSIWFPATTSDNTSFALLKTAPSQAPGTWLPSSSSSADVMRIDVDGQHCYLKVVSETGRPLVSINLSDGEAFAFVLLQQGRTLLISAIGTVQPQNIVSCTIRCEFLAVEQGVSCAATLKAVKQREQERTHSQRRDTIPTTREDQVQQLLLDAVMKGDPEVTGAVWWADFDLFVGQLALHAGDSFLGSD